MWFSGLSRVFKLFSTKDSVGRVCLQYTFVLRVCNGVALGFTNCACEKAFDNIDNFSFTGATGAVWRAKGKGILQQILT